MRRPSRPGLIPVCISGTTPLLAVPPRLSFSGYAFVILLLTSILVACSEHEPEISRSPSKRPTTDDPPVTELRYFFPHAASIRDEITVLGRNFIPGTTKLFLNDIAVDASVSADTIRFFLPFGLLSDSLTISVETADVKRAFREKIYFIKGRWTQLRPYEADRLSIITNALDVGGKGYATSIGNYKTPQLLIEFDPHEDRWRQITTIPDPKTGVNRWFALRDRIFSAGLGSAFWMYDLTNGAWHHLDDHPVEGWHWDTGNAFTFDGFGYIGLGRTNYEANHQLWKFNDKALTWNRVSDFPGKGTTGTLSLVTDDAVYFIGGGETLEDGNRSYKELWRYNPPDDTWERLPDFPGNGSYGLNGTSLHHKIYAGGGKDAQSPARLFTDFWEYDPQSDKWKQVVDLPVSRHSMYSYSFNDDGYLGAGETYGYMWHHDIWKFEVQ